MIFGKKNKGQISELVSYSGIYMNSPAKAEGEIHCDEDIFIDCEFRGEIITSGVVELAHNCVFTGNIAARAAIIEGKANGNFEVSESIRLAPNSELKGTVNTKNITIDNGSKLDAKIVTS